MNRMTIAAVMMIAGLSGCAGNARVIQKNPDSIVIAIPENSDVWPTHYRAAADALAKQQIGSTTVVEEREVVTGGPNAAGPTSTVTPASREYRITYAKRVIQSGLPINGPGLPPTMGMRPMSGPGSVTPAGAGMGSGLQPVGGSMPGGSLPGNMNGMSGMSSPNSNSGMNNSLMPSVAPGPQSPMSPYNAAAPYNPSSQMPYGSSSPLPPVR